MATVSVVGRAESPECFGSVDVHIETTRGDAYSGTFIAVTEAVRIMGASRKECGEPSCDMTGLVLVESVDMATIRTVVDHIESEEGLNHAFIPQYLP